MTNLPLERVDMILSTFFNCAEEFRRDPTEECAYTMMKIIERVDKQWE